MSLVLVLSGFFHALEGVDRASPLAEHLVVHPYGDQLFFASGPYQGQFFTALVRNGGAHGISILRALVSRPGLWYR